MDFNEISGEMIGGSNQENQGGMLDGGDDDLFGDSPTQTQNQTNIFGAPDSMNLTDVSKTTEDDTSMLAGENDGTDIFATTEQTGTAMFSEPSPVQKWTQTKQGEIAEQDKKETDEISALKEKASNELSEFHERISESQSKRAAHNKEIETEFIKSQTDPSTSDWERVVNQIDFNRTDLHEKDNSKMKILLLQLKNQ